MLNKLHNGKTWNAVPISGGTEFHGKLGRPRKYTVNDRFFSVYNESTCYWAGFIAADGALITQGKNKNSLHIALNKIDKAHLQTFLKDIKSNCPIYEIEKTNSVRMQVYSEQIIIDLQNKFNIGARKTYRLQFPAQLPQNMYHHFIRGFVDGDGSFYLMKRKTKPQWGFSVVGASSAILNSLKEILNKITQKTRKLNKEKKSWRLQYGGNHSVKSIVDYLYNNATIFLDRKKPINIILTRKKYEFI